MLLDRRNDILTLCPKCKLEYAASINYCPRCRHSYWLKIASIGVLIATIGVGLAFSIDYGPNNPISYIAFTIVISGVLTGFAGIVGGLISQFFGRNWYL